MFRNRGESFLTGFAAALVLAVFLISTLGTPVEREVVQLTNENNRLTAELHTLRIIRDIALANSFEDQPMTLAVLAATQKPAPPQPFGGTGKYGLTMRPAD